MKQLVCIVAAMLLLLTGACGWGTQREPFRDIPCGEALIYSSACTGADSGS